MGKGMVRLMYGANLFGQVVCGVAIAIGSAGSSGGRGYGTQNFGSVLSAEQASYTLTAPNPPIPPVPPTPQRFVFGIAKGLEGEGFRRFSYDDAFDEQKPPQPRVDLQKESVARNNQDAEDLAIILTAWLNLK